MQKIDITQLNNGYVYLFENFRLFKEHNIYVLCGFDKLNNHFYYCFNTIKETKQKLKNLL